MGRSGPGGHELSLQQDSSSALLLNHYISFFNSLLFSHCPSQTLQKIRMATSPRQLVDLHSGVTHTRIGIWDLYEERGKGLPRRPDSSILKTIVQIRDNMPYVVRMFKEILNIRRVRMLLPSFLVVQVLDSLIPAVSLWCDGQLLRLVETMMETSTVDTTVVIHVAVGRVTCAVASHLLRHIQRRMEIPINMSIRQFYTRHVFHSMARLDLPTFTDSAVRQQLGFVTRPRNMHVETSLAWEVVQDLASLATTTTTMISQFFVLFTVLQKQQDGPLLMILGFSQSILRWYRTQSSVDSFSGMGVWAATTTNNDYIRMQGLQVLTFSPSHRKELVAGNLSEYITSQFCESALRLGDDAGDFNEVYEAHSMRKFPSITTILRETMPELPQIAFMLNAVRRPTTVPLSFASLQLIEHVSDSLISTYLSPYRVFNLTAKFAGLRNLYELKNVQNKVMDGTERFPGNQQSLISGISVEFRNVSFQYSDEERYALRDVSFRIEASQLCVIVGGNGSGKSTILKLISRIYDPTEGTILIDNRDIKTFRLADLRAAMSILFQDYTHFPLSIGENIGLGNPGLAQDDDKIHEAAKMGGARDFIEELPDGFSTYIDRPVKDQYANLPAGVTVADDWYSGVRNMGGLRTSTVSGLSGGQNQRLALSRTFMRSLVTDKDSSAGMLVFDEPSASLDPTAENDLFENLRKLKGSKTIIFSTHRFGNLTRHADLILYMDESVQEQGTHDELLKKGGEYARIWNIQAKPFL
ncbi:P-loop containing nucleoside triphosphate hydrolase protein [Suillus fuscotomentosus]|uniref:P-loop containing nucleoside triphosphate hydrolase protein n=1 Tax=Suillus fuscotomentosus TaxID=1912939 RepID=A0AAD4ELW8_9AGAM|nr:P-loop containing nucleoside triphosphate hydrolase protein [Suillus fuscotomentosus]KAG1908604.1 P-loop containing nucleoside triphosphate hydrolase protein [Suillus fuscotomentosus]